jgi:hypothetical protein
MTKVFAIAAVFFMSLASFGCSSVPKRETVKLEDRPSGAVQKDTDVGVPVANVPQLSEIRERIPDKERVLPDNSRLITSFDEDGNRTETRVFPDGSDVSSVTIRTDSDGNVQSALYTKNGQIRSVTDDERRSTLSASAADIVRRVEPQDPLTRSPERPQAATPTSIPIREAASAVNPAPMPTPDVRSIQLPVVIKVGTR